MVPDDTALVPALGCLLCGRLIPLTAIKSAQVKNHRADERRQVLRALRASRRNGRAAL